MLVGTTKFYEIDLKSFSAEVTTRPRINLREEKQKNNEGKLNKSQEFLDLSNPGVRAVTGSPAFQGSLPKYVTSLRHAWSRHVPRHAVMSVRVTPGHEPPPGR